MAVSLHEHEHQHGELRGLIIIYKLTVQMHEGTRFRCICLLHALLRPGKHLTTNGHAV